MEGWVDLSVCYILSTDSHPSKCLPDSPQSNFVDRTQRVTTSLSIVYDRHRERELLAIDVLFAGGLCWVFRLQSSTQVPALSTRQSVFRVLPDTRAWYATL